MIKCVHPALYQTCLFTTVVSHNSVTLLPIEGERKGKNDI